MRYPEGITERNWNALFSKHANSSMVADVLNEMGYRTVITGLSVNLPGKKVFGRASTLKIRKLRDGEDPDGIYRALESYSTINDGDIIVVENEVPSLAYFGELNANLAIRAGAIGTIVGGRTRDIERVSDLDYPVFSKGYSSADIKGYGTTDSIGEPLKIEGIPVSQGDLVFADINGIAVIPQEISDEVIEAVISCLERESRVKLNAIRMIEAPDIARITGNF